MTEIEVYRHRHPYCEVCGVRPVQVHHIRSRGAGGCDCPVNLIALCPFCHSESHTKGQVAFFKKYGITGRLDATLDHHHGHGTADGS